MKKTAVLFSLLALSFTGCVSASNEPMIQCEYDGLIFYCPETNSCGSGICIENSRQLCGRAMANCGPEGDCIGGICHCMSGDEWKMCSGTCCMAGCVDTKTDAKNCGTCGKACDSTKEICMDGVCTAKKCGQGLSECMIDGDVQCINLSENRLHCGECGKACPEADSSLNIEYSTCAKNSCVLICTDGWFDEDGNPDNGCEARKTATCGNQLVEEGEECDGYKLDDQTCETVVGYGSTGHLTCDSECHFVTKNCTAPDLCGNQELNTNEKCDGTEMGEATCAQLVGEGSEGTLLCTPNCADYITAGCSKPTTCGNGRIDENEKCDGALDASITCELVVGKGSTGTVKCAENCASYDVSGCTAAFACGNGIIEGDEECDRDNLNSKSCESVVGAGSKGTLKCSPECRIDKSQCSAASACGNNKIDNPEVCDGTALNKKTCADIVGIGSTGTLKCSENCANYDISNCSAPASCGNNRIEKGEVCDGSKLNDKTCADVVGNGSTGTLTCNKSCTDYVRTGCSAKTSCGNGKLDTGEVCDGNLINGATCESKFGKGSKGTVLCSKDCKSLDYSSCSAAESCNNGVLEKNLGEVCDKTNLDGESCESIVGKGSKGTLSCGASCKFFDISQCTRSQYCGDGKIQTGEKCDMTNLAGRTCADKEFLGEGAYGTLRCNATCNGFDTTGCKAKPQTTTAVCGNGIIEEGEACDKLAFGKATCKSETHNNTATGTLTCAPDCKSILTTNCEFCGDGKLKDDASEECDGTDWMESSCTGFSNVLYSGGTLRCDQSTCMLDTKDCTLKSTTFECANESETRCDNNKLLMCDHNVWTEYLACGTAKDPYPVCSALRDECLPTQWCNTQQIEFKDGSWSGYGQYHPVGNFKAEQGWLLCTQNLNTPVDQWEPYSAVENKSCLDCGSNIEFKTDEPVLIPSGTSYCIFAFFFGNDEYVCPPGNNAVSEPVLVNEKLKLTPETSWIVNN